MLYHLSKISLDSTKSGDLSLFERNCAVFPCVRELPPSRIIVLKGFPQRNLPTRTKWKGRKQILWVLCARILFSTGLPIYAEVFS
jgi:hypothetical protein